MRIACQLEDRWPPLAWVARCGSDIEVQHGRGIEAHAEWAFEGAWAGPFEAGGFGESAVVCGSGVVVDGDEAVFVSPASTIDRLCSIELRDGTAVVSNSLLALLAAVGGEVVDPKYPAKARSIVRGVDRCAVAVATTAGFVRLTYFENLAWSGRELTPRAKPRPAPGFRDFSDYLSFLDRSFAALSANAADPQRGKSLRFQGTVSSGFDANAATALAAKGGCGSALAFETTGRGHPDSGVPVAEALGVEPLVMDRDDWRNIPSPRGETEVPVLAAGAGSGLIEFHAASEHLDGSLLVTGFYGDSIWNPEWADLGPDIVRKDASGLGFCEYRLHAGFANCAPAFWAAREVADVVRISGSDEMAPWRLGGGYDRPIPRRILEEAGVPREAFGRVKRAVPKAQPHRDARFLTTGASEDYFAWLRESREPLGLSGPISPLRDRAEFAWRDLTLRAHVALGKLPHVARTSWWRARRAHLRQRRRKPTPLRAHTVAWALDRGRRNYPQPSEGTGDEQTK